MDGVIRARLNYGAAKLHVWGEVSPSEISRRANQSGYEAIRIGATGRPARSASSLPLRVPFTLFSGLFLLMAASSGVVPWIDAQVQQWLLVGSIVAGGLFPFRSAFFSIKRRSLDMNVLMSVATLGAGVIGEWFEGATVIFLFSVGELLEAQSLDRARRSISNLMSLAPDESFVLRDGEERLVPTEQVQAGDVCIIRPGQRIPVDGRILEGDSLIDEASVTGESVPVEKGPDDPLFAGTINGPGALRILAERPASDSTLARIVSLVEEAQDRKAPLERFVDRFSRIYTPVVMGIALGVAGLPPLVLGEPFSPWIYRGLALLVLSCPCALVISTPVAIVSALSNAARNGLVIKGGVHLEALADVDTVVFDKTGTLTHGRLEVTDITPLDTRTPDALLGVAAGVEWGSEHPIGTAIVDAAKQRDVEFAQIGGFEARPGLGALAKRDGTVYRIGSLRYLQSERVDIGAARGRVDAFEGEGKTVVGLAEGLHLVGIIALSDSLKEESIRAVRRLKQLRGIEHVAMLTGDNRRAATSFGKRLAIDEVRAELLPEGKVKAIEAWQQDGRKVAMVGDGVNDSPGLAAAQVGIAMGVAGSDAAIETADVALMSDDLSRLPFAILLARRTIGVIRQNVAFAIGVKALALLLLFAGELTLWMAIASDMGASLLVTFNGLRLLGRVRLPSGRSAT